MASGVLGSQEGFWDRTYYVYYVSTVIHTPIDNRTGGINYTYVSLTPGFRCHLGENWYALGGVEVPVVHPLPYQYAPTAWLMKVF
jgi:hypothetical protein